VSKKKLVSSGVLLHAFLLNFSKQTFFYHKENGRSGKTKKIKKLIF